MSSKLTRAQIIDALRALEAECARRGITGEMCIYGGALMVLVFDARDSTRDVDAVSRPKSEILAAAQIVAERLSLPDGWLNDGVKGFLSHREELRGEPLAELEGLSNLRVIWPTPEYLLAMKCLAARTDATATDRADVEILVKKLGFTSAREVLEVVERFYPAERIHIRTRYFVEEVMAELKDGDGEEAE